MVETAQESGELRLGTQGLSALAFAWNLQGGGWELEELVVKLSCSPGFGAAPSRLAVPVAFACDHDEQQVQLSLGCLS